MKALVVDDHDLARKILRELLLADCGIGEVEEAVDGEEALGLFGAGAFDLVVLDMDMPRRDGLSFLAECAPSRPDCVYVVLSALPARDWREKALGLGASGYLEKGCAPEKIVAAIRAALAEGPDPLA